LAESQPLVTIIERNMSRSSIGIVAALGVLVVAFVD
jgi:hypothetical protein